MSEPVVSNSDIMIDSGRPLRSEDTRGLSVQPIIGFSVGCSFNNLTSAAEENGLSVLKEKSIADTLGTGTRKADTSTLSASSGRSDVTSSAADVVVGTIDNPAALLRAGSRPGLSIVGWLPV